MSFILKSSITKFTEKTQRATKKYLCVSASWQPLRHGRASTLYWMTVSMEEAAKTIAEKYKVKISLANDDLKKCRISATFLNGEDLDQVLTVVSGVLKATCTIQPDG